MKLKIKPICFMSHTSTMRDQFFVGASVRTFVDADLRRRMSEASRQPRHAAAARRDAPKEPFAKIDAKAPVKAGRKIRILASASAEGSDRIGIVEVASRHATTATNPLMRRSHSQAPSSGMSKPRAPAKQTEEGNAEEAQGTHVPLARPVPRDAGRVRGEILALLLRSKQAYTESQR